MVADRGAAVIAIQALSRSYGPLLALDDVSFTVAPGEIVGLLGANGAGKSTLMRTATGLQPPDGGVVRLGDVDLWAQPVEGKRLLGYAPEEPAFYEELSAEEYLEFLAGVRGLAPDVARDTAGSLFERFGLADRAREPVRGFSHGMRKKLSLSAALLHQPPALFLDEALEGFDAAAAIAAKDEMRARARAGAAILFSSHVTETIERLCDRVVILHRGRVARTLEREAWGAGAAPLSRLEGAFLEILRGGAGSA
jgi:ABC-2 type transport system ATP-binding protein